MKIKSLMYLIVIGTFAMSAFCFGMLGTISIDGIHKRVLELSDSLMMKVICTFGSLFCLFMTAACFSILDKLAYLDEIVDQAERLEKEKEKYKSATEAFVQMHKFERTDKL